MVLVSYLYRDYYSYIDQVRILSISFIIVGNRLSERVGLSLKYKH